MNLVAAGLIATAISFVLLITAAVWYAVPWMRRQPLEVALTAPLWVHAFRYVALQIFSAQQFGFHVSDSLAREIAWGDVAGAAIAFAALWLLRRRSRAAVVVLWLFIVESAVDLANATIGGIREQALAAAHAVSWLILTIYAPLLWVTLGLVIWRLVTRARQPA